MAAMALAFPDCARTPRLVVLFGLLVPGALLAGCVNLTQPENVRKCSESPGGCLDNPPPDAPVVPEVGPAPDLRPGDEPVGQPDLPPDGPPPPDAALDGRDGGSTADAPADRPTDTAPVSEVGPQLDQGGGDRPIEKPVSEAGPEPGPEPGKEPGPEPGPEPGKEPGPEPAPEPGKEPGPEPGPEPAPEPGNDGGTGPSCANTTPITGGKIVLGATARCFVTCDSMQYGWGCSSFTTADRTIKVNGSTVTCGGALPPKKPGGYYYFEIAAGLHAWDEIYWSGTFPPTCPAPTGGFVP